jgi:GT2 family glycosyltransferase
MDAGKHIDVSVIIVNYNTRQLTCDCIASVIEKTVQVNYEIIVVDNASSDDSVDFIKNKFPVVKLIANPINEGFGRANNTGAKNAGGKFLFLLNSDTLLVNDAIDILHAFMQKDIKKETGACCANLYTAEKNVGMIIGAHLFIRKEIFELLEGFDPHFFMYLEDTDLCLRIKKAGYKLTSVPQAKIIHYQGKSSLIGSKLIMESTSFIYYFKKHNSSLTVALYKGVEFSFALLKMIAFAFSPHRRKAYYELMKFLIT